MVEVAPHGQAPAAAGRALLARHPDGPLPDGGGLLLVRPTGVRLSAPHRGEHHLTGTVADVAFRGRGYEFAVDVPGHGRLTGVFARRRAARGETVGLRLEPEGCHLFPAASGPPDGVAAAAAGTAGEGLTQAPPDVHALSG